MKIALDPYMIRHLPLDRLPHARREASSRYMRDTIQRYVERNFDRAAAR